MRKKTTSIKKQYQRESKATKYALIFLLSSVMIFFVLIGIILIQTGVYSSFEPSVEGATSLPPTLLPLSPTYTATATQIPTSTPTATPSPIPTPTYPVGEAFSIGTSVEGRDIEVFRFGTGPEARMIIAGIHGGYEWNTSDLLLVLIKDIENQKIIIPPHITLYLLPILNPDGYYEHKGSVYGRANAHNVDINRNWDAVWEADWDRTGCFSYVDDINAGDSPFSEPETVSLSAFLSNNNITALISYHSAMASIFAGGRPEPDLDSDNLASTLAEVSGYSYPPNDGGICYYTGQLIDWASANGIAAVDIELTDHEHIDHDINRDVLNAFLEWNPQKE